MSEKNYRFFSHTHAGTDCRSAVRPRHARDSWSDRARSALSYQLSATSWLQRHKPGDVPKCQHSGIRRASARRAKRRWSDSSLQVEDLKASGTPTSLASTCATFLGSATTMAGRSITVCALCQRRSLASGDPPSGVLQQHFGHSGAMPAAGTGVIPRAATYCLFPTPPALGVKKRSFETLYGMRPRI